MRGESHAMPWVVRIYELPAGVGEMEETLAVVGPFQRPTEVAEALRKAGWEPYDWDREPMAWEAPSKRGLGAEVIELAQEVPAP